MNKCNELLDSLNCLSLTFQSLDTPYKANRKNINLLVHMLSKVNDFRNTNKIKYSLDNILAMCFILSFKGKFTSFSHAALYIEYHQDYFISLNLLERNKCPSHDTLRRIFMYLDANELRDVFINKIEEFLDVIVSNYQTSNINKSKLISIDGKEFKGSGRKNKLRNINVFNVYSESTGCCLSSTCLSSKDSEIKEAQRLLNKFKLNNSVITADALHCQLKTCEIITKRKGEYIFNVKDNQPSLKEEIIYRLDLHSDKVIERNHNNCIYQILILDKQYIGCDFIGQRSYIKMTSYKRKKDNADNIHYFISSISNINLIIEAIDNRWKVESGLHWFKDDLTKEDEYTFTDKNAIKTMATINNIVYAFYRLSKALLNDPSMKVTRIRFEDDPIELFALILPLLQGKDTKKLLKQHMNGKAK